ncbi:AraC family transcriptional regulator [Victivallis sp. Marseille-Q1083]|uniref:helix-turn-helix domain-containing protein n=1 Tax=Victivallis sp. Marseille-Q1083 TaxID=2717288 RepID=UPI00158DAEED|nr:AraC family transcriptional regulator [Victivallis sp. Marseille-Q1083]
MRAIYANHLKTLEIISFFSAPAGVKELKPFISPPGHETIEILTGGKVWFEQDGRDRLYERGTIFWHVAGEPTICRMPPETPYRCLVFHFNVNQSAERPAPRVSFWRDTATLDGFANEVGKAFHHERCDVEQLAAYCYHTLLWQSNRFDHPGGSGELSPKLRKAMNYLEQHLAENISVGDLAANVRISRPYLFELFKTQLGLSPYKYLSDLRLNRARQLLADNTASIKEIAAICGFENLEVFYRAFKRATNLTPGQYREENDPYNWN